MKTTKLMLIATGSLACMQLALSAEVALPIQDLQDSIEKRNHLFYVGFGFGPTQLKPGSDSRTVEGIDFKYSAGNNNLGGETHAGFWISDNVALEIGARDYGKAKVPFAFSDPHDNSTGTGESEVDMSGFNISVVLGYDITPKLQLFVRAGVLQWKETFDSRFDIPGQAAMHRTYDQSGTGMSLGAGVSYRFHDYWHLQAQYEHDTFDVDQVSMVSVGMSYDFIGLTR